jgi:hypothetical protein
MDDPGINHGDQYSRIAVEYFQASVTFIPGFPRARPLLPAQRD